MIQKTTSFKTTDGKVHASIEEAQKHELTEFIGSVEFSNGVEPVVIFLLKNRDKIVDLLTTKASSKLAARRINGGTKKRTAKPDAANVNPLSPATK